ncbi:hypothetical protein NHX12_030147, partial [Muraenolepis orangiensis]
MLETTVSHGPLSLAPSASQAAEGADGGVSMSSWLGGRREEQYSFTPLPAYDPDMDLMAALLQVHERGSQQEAASRCQSCPADTLPGLRRPAMQNLHLSITQHEYNYRELGKTLPRETESQKGGNHRQNQDYNVDTRSSNLSKHETHPGQAEEVEEEVEEQETHSGQAEEVEEQETHPGQAEEVEEEVEEQETHSGQAEEVEEEVEEQETHPGQAEEVEEQETHPGQAEEVEEQETHPGQDIATMQLCANKLDKKDFFGKSDPFLVFYRSNEDGTFTICHKTEVIKNNLNPVWQSFTLPVRALCNGDYDRTVKVDVFDWDRDGSHDFIGEFTTSYRELSRGQSQFNVYEVLNPKKKGKKKKYVNSGTVTLLSFKVESEYTFPTSLHYMSPYQMNAYAMALKAVGEIIQDYDSDKLFPAYGFGAKLPPDGKISHAFPLNSNSEDPNCVAIAGVLEAYFQSLRSVQLYGPTNFAPVINQVARHIVDVLALLQRCAADLTDGSQYFVLLMITDGVISDMAQTKEAVVNAAGLPMSIIIVGVGPAEFDAMEELDGDEVRVSSRGRFAERDIVQFVPFRDYMDRSGNQVLSMARLAKDVLAEIPDQLLSFMRSRGIEPRPAVPAPTSPSP